jgi:hypothetical protein
MDFITYKDKQYPTKTFWVDIDGDEELITISVQSLSDAMGVANMETDGTDEQCIDSDIYFYVADELIYLDERVICAEHLDKPLEFIVGEI